jgi:hypothetical protein
MSNSKLHYVQPSPRIGIIRASEVEFDISTADTDEQGYLVQNGTNRSLACGITERGDLTLIMRTNGDDEALCDDVDNTRAMALTMSDSPQCDIKQGFARLRSGIEAMRAIYTTDAAQEQIDELEQLIQQAEDAD